MSFVIEDYGGYGSGALGDVTDPEKSIINAYAAVNDIGTYDFLAIPYKNSAFVTWKSDECVGCQVMLHAIACKNGASGYSLCGRYLIATITDAVLEGDYSLRVTIDQSTAAFAAGKNSYFWQAVLIPEFKNLTLESQSVKPLGVDFYDMANPGDDPFLLPLGGVLALKCSGTLTLHSVTPNGGHIDLRDAGFPTDISTTYRPSSSQEAKGTLDTAQLSGYENFLAKDKLLLNAGDGACFIMAKSINCSSGSSRIGNPSTSGKQYCRGASDSENTPANVSNLGGSSIFVACDGWTNFTPAVIAKYHTGTGRGLARAYLAVSGAGSTVIPDEGLYALDCLQNKKRPKERFNLSGFGKGTDGNYNPTANPQNCWNSYAAVTAISGKVYTIRRVRASVTELTDFEVGRLVMIHQTRKTTANDYTDGDFKLSRIVAVSGSTVTIKHNFSFNLSTYNVQMIVVPEFNNLTLTKVYNNTPCYQNGAGGIFAVCCAGTCHLSGGTINMEGRGTFSKVVNELESNYWMKRGLPLGQGNGSILIVAKNLTMNTSTRLGGTYDGATFGGKGGAGDKSSYPAGGGWRGSPNNLGQLGGWGGGAGTGSVEYPETNGGWHSNAQLVSDAATEGKSSTGCQGAHILIIADTITGFNLSAMSTGGGSGYADGGYGQEPGGCGYGGGGKVVSANHGTASAGGYRGGGGGIDFAAKLSAGTVSFAGGGAGGSCFVYCNNVVDQVTTGLVLS